MRKVWLDDLRWYIILLVVVHHLVCFFNSAGVPMNVNAPGLPVLDAVAYWCYPWLMPCMFLLAGISARCALEGDTVRHFLARRARRLLIPFAAGVILLGVPLVWLAFAVKGGSVAEMIAYFPSPVLALFLLALMGMGPQWFLLALFVITLLFLPLRGLDRSGRLERLGEKGGLPLLLGLWPVYWACSQALNATNRYLLYYVLFLLGYFLFSSDRVTEPLRRYHLPLLAGTLGLSVWMLARWFGRSFADVAFVEDPVTTLFGWCATLAAVGCARAWGGRDGRAARFWRARGFAVYQFHYLTLTAAVYGVTAWLDLPVWMEYLLPLGLTLLACLILYEVLRRIPALGDLFGLRQRLNEARTGC